MSAIELNTAPRTEAEDRAFAEDRKKGIGGSDLASLLHIGFLTEYELWMDKQGKLERKISAELQEVFHFGHMVEPLVAAEFMRRNNMVVQEYPHVMQQDDCVLRGNADRIVVPSADTELSYENGRLKGATGILEIKNVSEFGWRRNQEWGTENTDEIPQNYWVQLQVYMGLAGVEFGYLAALVGGSKYAQFTVEFNSDVYAEFKELANNWWQRHIVEGVPPKPTNEADARRHYRAAKGKKFFLDEEQTKVFSAYVLAKEEESASRKNIKELNDWLIPLFEDADTICSGQGTELASYKERPGRTTTDWAACFAKAAENMSEAEQKKLVAEFTSTADPVRVFRLGKNAKELLEG